MSTRILLKASMLATLLFASSTASATPLNENKVVRDDRGQVVHAYSSGTCVRTVWVEGQDVCAPVAVKEVKKEVVYVAPPPPPPQIVQQRVDVLNSDEKVVYFPFDSAELVPESQAKLDTVAQKLSAASSVKGADIVGFADRMGANSYNQTLSERRAHAVQDYLTEKGYLNTRIARTRGLGETHPVTTCSTKAPRDHQIHCLGADRRVELEVQYTQTKVENKVIQPTTYAPPPVPGELMYRQPAAADPANAPPSMQQY